MTGLCESTIGPAEGDKSEGTKNLQKLEQKELEKMEIKRELTYKQDARKGEQGVANNFDNFQIGSRFKLQNVHFYPGTEKAIEPYSSREVEDLALFLKKNPAVSIEISGHIYETKKINTKNIHLKRFSDIKQFNINHNLVDLENKIKNECDQTVTIW